MRARPHRDDSIQSRPESADPCATMSPDLKPGIRYRYRYTVSETKTVPNLYPEFGEFREMPEVFATGFLVGLLEGACQLAIKPYLDWPREQSLGTHVNFSHLAATPPGLTVTVDCEVLAVDGRRVVGETWLREARSRGMLLLAPTSRSRTWSIMGGPDVDGDARGEMVEAVAARHPVDRGRVLLTGMSDGATYALLLGLREGLPFTHLAPACGVLHPFLLADGGIARARGRPVYLVHGALDWMFPVPAARLARDMLAAAGARLVHREIEDLSHTYPRDENPRILDWLMAA